MVYWKAPVRFSLPIQALMKPKPPNFIIINEACPPGPFPKCIIIAIILSRARLLRTLVLSGDSKD